MCILLSLVHYPIFTSLHVTSPPPPQIALSLHLHLHRLGSSVAEGLSSPAGRLDEIMANKAKGLAAGVAKWFKKPWEITGPVSSAEFMDPLPMAGVYRKTSPATPTQRAIVPHAEPEHVFDIKYYVRDTRRAPPKLTEIVVPANGTFEGTAPAAGKFYTMGEDFPITDEPGEGYQK